MQIDTLITRLALISAVLLVASAAATSCNNPNGRNGAVPYYKIVKLQPRVAQVIWNPDEFDFEKANKAVTERYVNLYNMSAGGCTSWRNGRFHGRNFDWMQSDFGCIVLQMPAGKGARHASVSIINGNPAVDGALLDNDSIDGDYRNFLPCMAMDGINDAGVAANINIIHHTPGDAYIRREEGDLSCVSVVRYVLDNAGSVDEAIGLLSRRKVSQDLVAKAGDDTHFMISDAEKTAVVEYDNGEMVVLYYHENGNGCRSGKGNPAIMSNLFNIAVEKWGLGTDEFYENRPFSLGVERWATVLSRYDDASRSVETNLDIAQSVWYFKNFMSRDNLWYSECADHDYGKDGQGWYCMLDGKRVPCSSWKEAQLKAWETMPEFRDGYDERFGKLADPHVKENGCWETSHSVIYDLSEKKGYLCAFEGFYSKDDSPIEITLPGQDR